MKISLSCISSYLNFVFLQRRDRQEAFFGDIFPQKAEPQHRKCFSFIEKQRFNLVMHFLNLRLTVFIKYFCKFLTLAVLI